TSYDEYQNYVQLLVKTGSIDNGKKIWWDMRAHPSFPTIEFRVCDMPTRLAETICLAGLMQAICAKLLKLRERNLGFRKYMPALTRLPKATVTSRCGMGSLRNAEFGVFIKCLISPR